MSIQSLIYKFAPTKIGDLILDCTLRENHDLSSKVTEYPVESGATMADHVIKNPREITLEGMITNSPLLILGGRLDKQARGTTRNGKMFGAAINRAELAFQELEAIYDEGRQVDIVGRFKVYKGMAMTTAPISRTPEDGDAIHFTATFREIRTVSLKYIDARSVYVKEETSQPKRKTGEKTPTTSTTPVQKKVSILKQGLRGIKAVAGGVGRL